jgi:hypothetical protein
MRRRSGPSAREGWRARLAASAKTRGSWAAFGGWPSARRGSGFNRGQQTATSISSSETLRGRAVSIMLQ